MNPDNKRKLRSGKEGEAGSCDTVSGRLTRGETHLREEHGSKHARKRKLLLISWSEIAYAMNYKKPCGYCP